MNKTYYRLLGAVSGLLNGFFGSGGGVAAVPLLEKAGTPPKKAHATSIAITFILSIVSIIFYLINNSVDLSGTVILIPSGIVGALVGCFLMKKIPTKILKRIFGGLLIISAVRLFFV